MRLLLLLLAACTTTPADTDTDTGTASDTASDSGTETDTERTDLAHFTGAVMDDAGAPLDGARVSVCRAICRTQTVDSTGLFDFQVEPETHSIHVEPPHDQSVAHASALFPLTFAANEERDVTVTLPLAGTPRPLPTGAAAELDLDGVLLTLQDGDLAVALSPDPVLQVSGARLAPELYPPLQLDGDVLAVWYLSPYNAGSNAGVPVAIALEPGVVTGGEALRLWRADYATFSWVDDGEVLANSDGTRLEGSALLHGLTTLALVRTPAP